MLGVGVDCGPIAGFQELSGCDDGGPEVSGVGEMTGVEVV
jgi:hypothetical protein